MVEQFKDNKYLNLATCRMNGNLVPASVWFVQDQDGIYACTIANSGQVKRVRNYPQVKEVEI